MPAPEPAPSALPITLARTVKTRPRRWRRLFAGLLALALLAWGLRIAATSPSNQRDWSPDQARLPEIIHLDADRIRINNVRNARYRTADDFDLNWETRDYDLDQLETVWYVVVPFADWRGPAHTFLSFGFRDGRYLSISVEIRKEQGEVFSPIKGLFRTYELMYVLGDEQDLIDLRTNIRKNEVYLYKVRATPAQIRNLIDDMLERTQKLLSKPEFYNTVSNSCTSNIVSHVNANWPGRVPFSYRTLLPAYSDDLAYEIGLIDTSLGVEEFRAAHQINELAAKYRHAPDFSARIRERIAQQSGETPAAPTDSSLLPSGASDSFGD